MRCVVCALVCLAPAAWVADPQERTRGGSELAGAGDRARAIEEGRRAVAADPDDLEAHEGLATNRIAAGACQDVIAQLEPVVARHPNHARSHYALAFCYRKTGRPDDAVAAYGAYIKLRPRDPDPYYGYGLALREMGDRAGALQALRTYVLMERRAEESRWVQRAEAMIRELEGEEPPKVDSPDDLGRLRTRVRDYPEDPSAWGVLAGALRSRGLEREAQRAERRAGLLVQNPPAAAPEPIEVAAPSLPETGSAEVDTGRIQQLRTRVRDDPDDAEGWVLLAEVLRAAGRAPEAEWAERRAAKLRPSAPRSLKAAQDEASALEAQLRDSAARLVEHGDRLFRAGRFAEALDIYREAADADRASAEAEYKSGLCAVELGRREAAAAAFKRALGRQPDHRRAREQLELLGATEGASPWRGAEK